MLKPNISIFIGVITISLFIQSMSSDSFSFARDITCVNVDKKGHCKDWSESMVLYQYSDTIFYCFPGDSYVLTIDGPKQMKHLTVEDSIFGMNLETGKNQFTNVTAWLHYDAHSLMDYSTIQLQNSTLKFTSSKYHNIGYSNDSQTNFKFLKDLSKNDALISLSSTGETFRVSTIDNKVEKEGLFSPLTETGTFYIYPDSFDAAQFAKNEQLYPMILVHSLSQIRNPIQNVNTALSFVKLSQVIFGQYQPAEDEQYVNPIINEFSLLFGSDWEQGEKQKIAHRYTTTYSSTRNRRQRERKRKTVVILASETIFSDTLL